jgi:hypothetical protein
MTPTHIWPESPRTAMWMSANPDIKGETLDAKQLSAHANEMVRRVEEKVIDGTQPNSSRAAHLLFATILPLLLIAPRAFAAFGDITLVGHLTLPVSPVTGVPRVTNVWGYYDYKTHKEYALVGDDKGGFFIVNVTDPQPPPGDQGSRCAGA